jgi:hypothetical protein
MAGSQTPRHLASYYLNTSCAKEKLGSELCTEWILIFALFSIYDVFHLPNLSCLVCESVRVLCARNADNREIVCEHFFTFFFFAFSSCCFMCILHFLIHFFLFF